MEQEGTSQPTTSSPSSINRPYWTPQRIQLRDWLGEKAPGLAELYEGAAMMIYEHQAPGRVKFAAHAIREIGNRLPDYWAGKEESGGNLQYINRLDEIAPLWKDHEDIALETTPLLTATRLTPVDPVPISPALYVKLSELMDDHLRTREKPYDKARRLFNAIAPEGDNRREGIRPALLEYVRIVSWAVGKCHGAGKADAEYDWDEIVHTFETFESCLISIASAFYVTIESLDEILEDTNN
jgi:hypothetical protein